MARGRKSSSVSLDEKISKQKELLEKSKTKYEADKAELAELIKLRNNLRKEELMDAVIKSDKSYEEILAFLRKKETEE